jgi:uncharacterized protein
VRLFLDTNVLASSIATRGLCNEVFELVIHDHTLLTCEPLFAELARVLSLKLRIPKSIADEFIALLRQESQLSEAQSKPRIRIPDADDIPLLASALAAKADLFVTGDKALLELKEIDGMPVISPRELWIRLAGAPSP